MLAAQQRALPLVGRDVDEMVADLGGVYRELKSDSQLRWLGPEKGVEHLAMAAVMNAVWDLAARRAGKPLWRLLVDMTPEQLVDAGRPRGTCRTSLTREEARRDARASSSRPAPSASPSSTRDRLPLLHDERRLARLLATRSSGGSAQEAVDEGYWHVKLKVGANVEDDVRRLRDRPRGGRARTPP